VKPIIMPQVGQDIPDALIGRWLKKENDRVEKGEVLLVVESDKASFEVEAECPGVLVKVLHLEGERVEVFQPVAFIDDSGEDQPSIPGQQVPEELVGSQRRPNDSPIPGELNRKPASLKNLAAPSRKRPSSPSARRLARELGIDLAGIKGTGMGRRIIKRDVLEAASAAATSTDAAPAPLGNGASASSTSRQDARGPRAGRMPALSGPRSHADASGDQTVPFTRVRQVIAERLTASKRTIPHFHLSIDVDMTDTLDWRITSGTQEATRISVNDVVIFAVASVLGDFPFLNSHVGADKVILRRRINIGVAVAVEEGLLVPVIPDAASLTLPQIAEWSKRNAEAAHKGLVDTRHVGTFTVSSLGMYGITRFLPIINPPECAVLGVGAAEPRVVPIQGGIGVRQMMTLDLACDHRAVDGTYAAGFLKGLKAFLEDVRWIPEGTSGQGGRS
jgi:pyruvate dehydrogenase E2 component (dihydrolipoamide acetyltransferase)